MMGLWNKLARPQERNAPFRLCALLLPRPGKAWRILLSGHPRGRGRGSARFLLRGKPRHGAEGGFG